MLLLFLLFVLFESTDGLLDVVLKDKDFLSPFVHMLLSLVIHLFHQFGCLLIFRQFVLVLSFIPADA